MTSEADRYEPPRDVKELLRRYQLGERNFVGTELDDAVYDLRNAVLRDADFSRSYIVADFRGADLRDAKFVDANVKTCDFSEADLRGAIFSGAALEACDFAGAKVEGADFTGAFCYGYELKAGEKPSW